MDDASAVVEIPTSATNRRHCITIGVPSADEGVGGRNCGCDRSCCIFSLPRDIGELREAGKPACGVH
jgi:hypothetical protein